MIQIFTKRAYVAPDKGDGFRVLVDRLWPRGLTHEQLDCQLWAKDIAPSAALREWFHADIAARWHEFQSKYEAELKANPAYSQFLESLRQHSVVTLVYASKDEIHNEATVLQSILISELNS